MARTLSTTGYERTATEQRTLGGAIVFVALLAIALLAVAHPGLAAATVLGAVGGHLAGIPASRSDA